MRNNTERSMNVNELLKGVDPRLRSLTESLRVVIRKSIPVAAEQVKWGNPTYAVNGKNVACIMHYKDHVNLGSFMGAKPKSKRLE